MPIQITYNKARTQLAKLCKQVTEDRDFAIITRPGGEDVALLPADELSSLLETVHLLKSPSNARQLLTALERARSRQLKSQTVGEFRREMGLGSKK